MGLIRASLAVLVAAAALAPAWPAAGLPGSESWQYKAKAPDLASGTLSTIQKNGATFVSIRQFCYALGCRVLHQWANHRAIVRNPKTGALAIVSSITRVAIVDGKVVDFKGEVRSDLTEGYLLPVDLASKLASQLGLGLIEERVPVAPKAVAPEKRLVLRQIVIDPGHGGHDLGTGSNGIYEKDVAFFYAVALREELLKAMPDLEVVLTRDSDRYVSLPDRALLANSLGANFFLSIHVNHAPDARIEGAETYILSPDATDDESRKVALLENESWMKTALKDHRDGDPGTEAVKKILIDMEQTRYIQDSALAASMIQQELARLERTRGLRNRGVKQAMFYVLSQVAMPSALVEVGFLSSTGDRSRLMDLAFRDEFVKSVVTAIGKFRQKTGGLK